MSHKPARETRIKQLADVLFQQDGVIELTAPGGEVFRVKCQRGVSMAFTRLDAIDHRNREGDEWRIRRGAPDS